MTNQQAISHLENMKWLKGYDNTSVNGVPLVDIIDDIIALLRGQEPQEPFYCEADDSWGCGNCGETVGYGEYYPLGPVRNKYCKECGKRVKWD